MRIRKRQVPSPLSSLSPVPLSDPNSRRPPVVQLQLEDDTAAYYNPPSSNPPIGDATKEKEAAKDSPVKLLLQKDEIGEDGEISNYSRKSSFYNAQTEMLLLHESNSSRQDGGRWFEGEKAFPLKKRRGNMERSEKKMKTKTNKKGQLEAANGNNNNNQQTEEEEEEEIKENTSSTSTTSVNGGSTGKKKVRGGALMEGSRCSRVNGRGWRCCQQTLVGYSLCEHHLGKGRLRSMTSVRNRSIAAAAASSKKPTFSPSPPPPPPHQKLTILEQQEDGDDDHNKIEVMFSKRKMKLGVVKARSMSSLLGQAATNNNAIPMVENNNDGLDGA